MEKTKDIEIRTKLLESPFLTALQEGDENALCLQEFALTACETRIDVVVFNGSFHGFEIKSDKDNLDRLPHQALSYGKIFEYLYLVVGKRHAVSAAKMLPDYWGIWIAEKINDTVTLDTKFREAKKNTEQDPLAIASMLWRAEALGLLRKFNLDDGVKTKPRRVLWEKLSEYLSLVTLEEEVRRIIKTRGDWRVALKQGQCDVMSRPSSKLSRCLAHTPF